MPMSMVSGAYSSLSINGILVYYNQAEIGGSVEAADVTNAGLVRASTGVEDAALAGRLATATATAPFVMPQNVLPVRGKTTLKVDYATWYSENPFAEYSLREGVFVEATFTPDITTPSDVYDGMWLVKSYKHLAKVNDLQPFSLELESDGLVTVPGE